MNLDTDEAYSISRNIAAIESVSNTAYGIFTEEREGARTVYPYEVHNRSPATTDEPEYEEISK